MSRGLNTYENKVLGELQNIIYQDAPLIDLVIKNYTDRKLSNEQISNGLYELQSEGKISVSDDTLTCQGFDRIILAHYEELHERRGGAGRGQGRKSREELGLEPVKNTTVQVEPSVIDACKEKHGSLANALRFAAKAVIKK